MSFPYPTVSHPRFNNFLTDTYLFEITPQVRANYIRVALTWDPLASTNPSQIAACAIAYFLTYDNAYLNKINQWVTSFDLADDRWPPGFAVKATCLQVAWLYDLFYDRLDPSQKEAWLRQVVRSGLEALRIFKAGKYSFLNSVTFNREGAATLACALAAYPEAETVYGKVLWDEATAIFQGYLEAWDETLDGGVWPEGWTYHGNGGETPYMVLQLADSSYNGELLKNKPYIKDLLKQAFYLVEPDGTAVCHGDQDSNLLIINKGGSWKSFLAFREMAFATDDPLGRAFVGNNDNLALPIAPWGHRRTKPALQFDFKSLPLYHDAKGAGVYCLRDSWNGEDAKMITIYCGGVNASHKPSAHGHFDIYNRGVLAHSARAYGLGAVTKHNLLYSKGSAPHNCLRIYDPEDQSHTKSYRVSEGVINGGTARTVTLPLPNDGGQKRVGSAYVSNMPITIQQYKDRIHQYESGKLIKADHHHNYDDLRFDLTSSYRSYEGAEPAIGRTNRVNYYERRFVYIRPSILVVIDFVSLTNPNLPMEWVIHTREEPTNEGHGIYRLNRKLAAQFEQQIDRTLRYVTPDGKYQYNGQAFIQPLGLMPNEIVHNGPDKWCEVNGVKYDSGQQTAYRYQRDWHPTDPTKAPIETCGHNLVYKYNPDGQSNKILTHVISLDNFVHSKLLQEKDGTSILFNDLSLKLRFYNDFRSELTTYTEDTP